MKRFLIMLSSITLLTGCGYEQAFRKADVDKIEVMVIPSSTVMQTRADGDYFSKSNDLFMRLFRYIQNNNVSMTTPVEAGMTDAAMTFHVGSKDLAKNLKDTPEVVVRKLPEREVVRIGGRGGYSRENLEAAEKKLITWLENNKNFRIAGKGYGVFWNSPFVPNLLKRYEVHIPVEKVEANSP